MVPVVIRNVAIGEGIPKICVPLTGRTKQELLAQAQAACLVTADIAEWRVDWFADASDIGEIKEALAALRAVLGDMPLLFTFRSLREGGERPADAQEYAVLNKAAAASGYVDCIDIELFAGEEAVKDIIANAHKCGVKALMSNHDFGKTPNKDEIINRLCTMQGLGADIVKIAVMPNSRADVITLLAATEEMCRLHAKCPVVTMSMSGMGVISRFCGEAFGSAMTFGSAGKASAPGQPDTEDLAGVLSVLHAYLEK